MKKYLFFFLFISTFSFAQVNDTLNFEYRKLEAGRISNAPKIDGSLTDECWQNIPIATDFITNNPVFGNPAYQKTECKIAYDDQYIYVYAYMYDTEPKQIKNPLAQRDREMDLNADFFMVGFDTYNDDQNAFRFLLTAAGVQGDSKVSNGSETDRNWDAVWDGKTSMQANGWCAEMRIPYSALRFAKKESQIWGFQIVRYIQRKAEYSLWSPVNPNKPGVVIQWGELNGLKNLVPPVRLSFLPYISSGLQSSPTGLSSPKYTNSRNFNGGMDIKYGINESFTLDMTLVPDFGQVQSDNVVLNLSPFEVQYDERRPFFTEGTELFNKADLFYSRRIGGTPYNFYEPYYQTNANEKITKNPSKTQLYNATKISGRNKNRLGIGFFNAVAAPMYATLKDTLNNTTRNINTSTLSNYNIVVLDQALEGQSSVTLTNTNVTRAGSARDANVTEVGYELFTKNQKFKTSASLAQSIVYEPNTSPTIGQHAKFGFAFPNGPVQVFFNNSLITNNYDKNDMGIQYISNIIEHNLYIQTYSDKKNKYFINRSYSTFLNYTTLFKPYAFNALEWGTNFNFLLKKFARIGFGTYAKPIRHYDYYEPRVEGKKWYRRGFGFGEVYYQTDNRKKLFSLFAIGLGESPVANDAYYQLKLRPTWRVNSRLLASFGGEYSVDNTNFGFLFLNSPNDIYFSQRRVHRYESNANIQFGFTPTMNINTRLRHYWTKVNVLNVLKLQDNGILQLDNSLTPNPSIYNKNFNAWNVDFLYSWNFKPGSFFTISYKNYITQLDKKGDDNYIKNLDKTFSTPSSNEIQLKLVYFIDYLQLRKRNKI